MDIFYYKIKGYKVPIVGIELKSGSVWTLVKSCPYDYRLDDFCLISQSYIERRDALPDNTLLYRALSLKYEELQEDDFFQSVPLDDYCALFTRLHEKSRLYGFQLHRYNNFKVGHITQVGKTSLSIKPVDSDLDPCPERHLQYNKIRIVILDSDYLKTMELLDANKRMMRQDRILLCPKESLGIFKFNVPISGYLNRGLRYTFSESVYGNSYRFHDYDLVVHVDEDGLISGADAFEECYWNGENLIGMSFKAFQRRFGLYPDKKERCVMDTGVQYIYTFETLSLLIWTKSGFICTVQSMPDYE